MEFMDRELDNNGVIKKPITRTVTTSLAIVIFITTLIIGFANYYHSLATAKAIVRSELIRYVEERGKRESALFLEAEEYQLRFQEEYIERFKRTSDREAAEWFTEHMEKRVEDGTYRSKPELYYGKDKPLGRLDVSASIIIGAETKITPELSKALAIGYDMINQYAPAWRKPFLNLYFASPEKVALDYWPGTPWGLIVNDSVNWCTEEWMTITTIEKNPLREQKWSGVLYDERDDNWMVSGVTPLDIEGEQVGLVGTDLLLDDLVASSYNTGLQGTYNILLQADGRVIVHPKKNEEIIANSGYLMAQESDEHLQNIYKQIQTMNTFPGVIENLKYKELLAITRIEGPDWYFVTVYPERLIFKKVFISIIFIILSGITSLLTIFFVTSLILKRNIILPLSNLTNTVKNLKISSGNSTIIAEDFSKNVAKLETRPDEFGLLANSFHALIENLDKTYKGLIENKERFDLAIRASKDGIYDWNLQTNEIYYSPRWKMILGYKDSELPNDLSIWEKLTNPDDVERSWKMQNELINRDREFFRMEFKMRHKDGHWVDILSRADAIFDQTGKAIRMIGTHIDISERKKAEESLANSEIKFRALFEQAGGYCMILDPNTSDGIPVIVDANEAACKIHGYQREDFIGNPVAVIDDEKGKQLVKQRTAEIMTGEPFYVENTHIRQDGTTFTVAVNAKRIDIGNEPPLIFSTEFDITDRKKSEKEIENKTRELEIQLAKSEKQRVANMVILDDLNTTSKILKQEIQVRKKAEDQIQKDLEVKKTLLQELYHRTKNNMQVISSMMRIKSREIGDLKLTEAFREIENKILSMALVHRRLYDSKDLSHIFIRDYIEDLVSMLKASFDDKANKIEFIVSGENKQVLFDTALPIGFIINELITNSIKHAFNEIEYRMISFKLSTDEFHHLVLEYSDNGKGLQNNSNSGKSAGIGIQTVRDLVEYQMRGKILFENRDGFYCKINFGKETYEKRV